jgi:AhpD family alkylhydroperoxidase
MSKPADFFEQLAADCQMMKEQTPEIERGFDVLHQTLMKKGALSVREKQLIALAIGLAIRCTPCIDLHVQGCLEAGASRAQILEAAGVAVVLQGGPAYTHVPEVIHALEHLQAKPGSRRRKG